ncbi:hypothetical protein BJ122_11526 [Rhodopseudomonas faecalis]|uniref:Uncharacterized protein n=1 Tax=Rhodopseudomonas faecalis TaxID=99655 RepID=A0A318TDX8_9BRAD|nr:hypothetical protein [Rhodopseudomonas faecalis]PYF01997.1 hypothetical protein BJ122_11526 [Rhodopseudomonas faecalis]
MADYYPLIARAIAGLDPNAPGEARRALYERARTALIAQLRNVQPPLSESEITRERLALEEAVRKVEAEAAQRARDAARTEQKNRARPGDAMRPGEARPGDPRSGEATRPGPRIPGRPAEGGPADAPGSESKPDQQPEGWSPEPKPGASADPVSPTRPEPPRMPGMPPRKPEQPGASMRGFRDVVADADDLGRAAAEANRAARKTYANVASPSPEFERLEPSLENRTETEPSYGYGAEPDDMARYQPGARPQADQPPPSKRVRGPFPIKALIGGGVLLMLIGGAFLWGPALYDSVRGMLSSQPAVVEAPKDASPSTSRPKITDRVGQPSSMDQIAAVAQRVVLYDEDPSDPKGKQYVGSVVWRTEPIKGAGAKPGDIAVRADLEIPERRFKMTMSFRRNTDSSLPASHTVELTFMLPPDFSAGGVSNVPGILMKSNEQARGTPLAGLAVKVTDGFFLVGLSNVESDRVRNQQLLKERSWFDIPLVYSNQRRAIIAIEKGSPGERAFNDAFAAWGG